ncbi:MAG TPA: ABC transporter substrate-binding protein, partial [Actinomycetes bacterium]
MLALLASSCTASEQSAQPARLSEVRVGVLAPLSGPSRTAGSDALHGAQLAAAVVSGDTGDERPASGLVDLGGGKVTIVSADTKSDPAAAAGAADQECSPMRRFGSSLRDAWRLAGPYWRSEERGRALLLLAAVVGLNLSLVGMNVLISYWSREFFNSMQERDEAAFFGLLLWGRQ